MNVHSGVLPAVMVITCFFAPASKAVEVDLFSSMPSVVTNVNLSHYDIGATGKGPAMFIATIRGEDTARHGLTFRMQILVNSPVLPGGEQRVYEGVTAPFDIGANEVVVANSNEFMRKTEDPSSRFWRAGTIYELENPELQEMVLGSGKIPTGSLRLVLILEDRDHTVLKQAEVKRDILNVSRLEPLTPGSEATDFADVPEVFSAYPTFKWLSDLDNPAIYGGADIFQFKLYRRLDNQTVDEVLASQPIYTIRTNQNSLQYPIGARGLVGGETYCWQVTALLKGIIDAQMPAKVFAFRLQNPCVSGQDSRKALTDLQLILSGTQYAACADQLKVECTEVSVTIDNQRVGEPELAELARQVLSGKYRITDATCGK